MIVKDMLDKIEFLSSDICYYAARVILDEIEDDPKRLYSSYLDFEKVRDICENIYQKEEKGRKLNISSRQSYCIKLFLIENMLGVEDLDDLVEKIRELGDKYRDYN